MRARYQYGSIQRSERKHGPDVWIYRWREPSPTGKAVRRGVIIGTLDDYQTKGKALKAAEDLRLGANAIRSSSRVVTFGNLIDRYVAEELPTRFSTRHSYLSNINKHIRPEWDDVAVSQVKPGAVRRWLRGLPLAGKSKGHIRCLMRQLFEFAMLWEIIRVQRNPMELVRIENTTKREHEPRVLTVEEFHRLLEQIEEEPFRTMLLTAICLGLRCSELLGLQWGDIDWGALLFSCNGQ